jgi:hypothetical protein
MMKKTILIYRVLPALKVNKDHKLQDLYFPGLADITNSVHRASTTHGF